MRKLLLTLMLLFLLTGCGSADIAEGDAPPNQPPADDQASPTDADTTNTENEEDAAATSGPDCYGPEIHPVGQSIADQFEDETSYDQVMVWFCNGMQFDDILTALQTETLTSVSADDLLEMLAGGLSWDQVWVEIGLTEE